MNNIAIRLATINDLPGILPLMHQLGYETDLSTLTVRFKNFTNQEGYGIAVADKDGEVMGWLHGQNLSFLYWTKHNSILRAL